VTRTTWSRSLRAGNPGLVYRSISVSGSGAGADPIGYVGADDAGIRAWLESP